MKWLLFFACINVAVASDYPSHPVRVVNPFPIGGSSDITCRVLADYLTHLTGQQFVVDNKGGSHGNTGLALVAKSTPDGHTILFTAGNTLTVNPFLYKDLGYKLEGSFAPVVSLGEVPNVLVVHPSLPVNTVEDLVSVAKQNPGRLNYASTGYGSSMHLAAELFQQITGTKLQHIPYVSPPQAALETVSNQTQLVFHLVPVVAGYVNTGKLRALMMLDVKRNAVLPDVLTSAESGLPSLLTKAWYLVLVPSKTPSQVVAFLNHSINQAIADKALYTKTSALGLTLTGGTPKAATVELSKERLRWGAVIKTAGIKSE